MRSMWAQFVGFAGKLAHNTATGRDVGQGWGQIDIADPLSLDNGLARLWQTLQRRVIRAENQSSANYADQSNYR